MHAGRVLLAGRGEVVGELELLDDEPDPELDEDPVPLELLDEVLDDELEERGGTRLLSDVELPLIDSLLAMEIVGIAVPGMPTGSPGMEGGTPEPYQVLTIGHDGSSGVFAEVNPR